MDNYIYLLREREFIKINENVFKLGKTTRMGLDRFKSYPNGSDLLLHVKCLDCHIAEKYLLKLFDRRYKKRIDVGSEYFEGDSNSMMIDIMNYIISMAEYERKYNADHVSRTDSAANEILDDGEHPESDRNTHEIGIKNSKARDEIFAEFILNFMERKFAGKKFDIEECPQKDNEFRFTASELNKEFKQYYADFSSFDLKNFMNKLGVKPKQMRISKNSNPKMGYVLYPPHVKNMIRKNITPGELIQNASTCFGADFPERDMSGIKNIEKMLKIRELKTLMIAKETELELLELQIAGEQMMNKN